MYIYGNLGNKTRKRRLKPETVHILKMVGLGLFMMAIGAVPPPWAIPRIIQAIVSKDTLKNRKRIRRRTHYLKYRGYIAESGNKYVVTERGKKILEEEGLWDLEIPTPKKWDGYWRLVVFDIPSEKSSVRIPFIRHLQNLGLIFYQRSVWIYPHPIENVVRKISDFYRISPHISFITALSIDGSATLRRKFKIV